MGYRLRPQDAQLARVVFWGVVFVVFLLLIPGCVTIKECGVDFKHRTAMAECSWCSGRAC